MKQIQPANFVDCIFPSSKKEDVDFHRWIPQATFWVHMDNSICHNGSKMTSKFEEHRVSRLPYQPDSPDISPYDVWPFEMLKRVLKVREFTWSDEIEEGENSHPGCSSGISLTDRLTGFGLQQKLCCEDIVLCNRCLSELCRCHAQWRSR
jgi:hypothetical protein